MRYVVYLLLVFILSAVLGARAARADDTCPLPDGEVVSISFIQLGKWVYITYQIKRPDGHITYINCPVRGVSV